MSSNSPMNALIGLQHLFATKTVVMPAKAGIRDLSFQHRLLW